MYTEEKEFDISTEWHDFSVIVELNIRVEPAQNGGMTDPSWSAYAEVDGCEILDVQIWSDEKNDYVKSYNHLFESGPNLTLLDAEVEKYDPELPDDGPDEPDYDRYEDWDYE